MMEHLTDITIIEFTAGNLGEEDSQRVRQHVSVCPQCMAKLEEFGLDWQQLGQWQEPEPLRDMTGDIHKLISAGDGPQTGGLVLFLSKFAFRSAAVILLGGIIGFIAGRYVPGRDHSESQSAVPEYMQTLNFGYASELTWTAMEEGFDQGAGQ